MTANAERQEATFATWADAREPELQRTAHLLTGDLRTARTVIVSALVSVLAAATRADPEDLDPLALRALVAEVLADRTSTLDHDVGDGVDPRLWDFLSTLSPARRAALVLRLHRHLGVGEVDDLSRHGPHGRRRRSRRTRGGLLLAGAALVAVAVPVAALSGAAGCPPHPRIRSLRSPRPPTRRATPPRTGCRRRGCCPRGPRPSGSTSRRGARPPRTRSSAPSPPSAPGAAPS